MRRAGRGREGSLGVGGGPQEGKGRQRERKEWEGSQCDHSLAFFTRSWLFVVHLGILDFYRFSIIIAFPKPCEFLAFFIGSPWHL